MIDGKVEIAHENEAAEGHGQVVDGNMRLGAISVGNADGHTNSLLQQWNAGILE